MPKSIHFCTVACGENEELTSVRLIYVVAFIVIECKPASMGKVGFLIA
jgi:hypothetical protein